MHIITTNDDLAGLCSRLADHDYVTVDTEFMRESTYWPNLCLIQIASDEEEAIIDPLAKGLDLAPLFELFANERVVKVFHAARQDVEIFHHLSGNIPTPLFDSQVAAMVCGLPARELRERSKAKAWPSASMAMVATMSSPLHRTESSSRSPWGTLSRNR